MTTNLASLKAMFDTLTISYGTATLTSDYYKQIVTLTGGISFIFDDKGNFITVKREK